MNHDYFLRQIEGIGDVLSTAMFGKKAGEPEEIIQESAVSAGAHTLLIDLRALLDRGELNAAENLLFAVMEGNPGGNYREAAMLFYSWLDRLDEETLTAAGFPREEIGEGRRAVEQLYTKRENREEKESGT